MFIETLNVKLDVVLIVLHSWWEVGTIDVVNLKFVANASKNY